MNYIRSFNTPPYYDVTSNLSNREAQTKLEEKRLLKTQSKDPRKMVAIIAIFFCLVCTHRHLFQ